MSYALGMALFSSHAIGREDPRITCQAFSPELVNEFVDRQLATLLISWVLGSMCKRSATWTPPAPANTLSTHTMIPAWR